MDNEKIDVSEEEKEVIKCYDCCEEIDESDCYEVNGEMVCESCYENYSSCEECRSSSR